MTQLMRKLIFLTQFGFDVTFHRDNAALGMRIVMILESGRLTAFIPDKYLSEERMLKLLDWMREEMLMHYDRQRAYTQAM